MRRYTLCCCPVRFLYSTEDAMTRKSIELIHEGRYSAEVPVDLIEDDTGWSPYLSLEDAKKLDAVRLALRAGEITETAKHGRVFELTPISGSQPSRIEGHSTEAHLASFRGWHVHRGDTLRVVVPARHCEE